MKFIGPLSKYWKSSLGTLLTSGLGNSVRKGVKNSCPFIGGQEGGIFFWNNPLRREYVMEDWNIKKSSDLKQLNLKQFTTFGNFSTSRIYENHLQSCVYCAVTASSTIDDALL